MGFSDKLSEFSIFLAWPAILHIYSHGLKSETFAAWKYWKYRIPELFDKQKKLKNEQQSRLPFLTALDPTEYWGMIRKWVYLFYTNRKIKTTKKRNAPK